MTENTGSRPCSQGAERPLVSTRADLQRRGSLNFRTINAVALASLPALLARWLPDGRREGNEYVARNPRRHDHHPGSFKINLTRGAWADFATGDRGGDRKSTRLNSSHANISYAVFCLKK